MKCVLLNEISHVKCQVGGKHSVNALISIIIMRNFRKVRLLTQDRAAINSRVRI